MKGYRLQNNDHLVDAGLNIIGKKIKKRISSSKVSGITIASNEIKDIMKVIKFLENRGVLIKGTTRKVTRQEGRFLMIAGLPLMTSLLTSQLKVF